MCPVRHRRVAIVIRPDVRRAPRRVGLRIGTLKGAMHKTGSIREPAFVMRFFLVSPRSANDRDAARIWSRSRGSPRSARACSKAVSMPRVCRRSSPTISPLEASRSASGSTAFGFWCRNHMSNVPPRSDGRSTAATTHWTTRPNDNPTRTALGRKPKGSRRATLVRCSPESGHYSRVPAGRRRAITGCEQLQQTA
jgi:hypothetical protein